MAVELIIGPAHAGKIAELYARYLGEIKAGRRASLVVPDDAAKTVTERELLERTGGVIGADIVTFDTLFERILDRTGDSRRTLSSAPRQLLLRRLAPDAPDALGSRLDRLGSALLDPALVRAAGDEELAGIYDAWWGRLDEQGVRDRGRMRIEAIIALRSDVAAWPAGEALFAQGFDDLSAAQLALVETVGQRARAVLSLPYEVGRASFAALSSAVGRLAAQAGGAGISDLPAAAQDRDLGLIALERRLGEPTPAACADVPTGNGLATAEVEGERGEAEVVVQEVAAALRSGYSGRRIAIIAPYGARHRARLVRQLGEAGITIVTDESRALTALPFGRALLALLQMAQATEPSLEDRLTWLQSPWSGAPRHLVDRCERQVRRSLETFDNAVEKAGEPILRALAPPGGAPLGVNAIDEVAASLRGMLQRVHGDRAPLVEADLRDDLVIARAIFRVLHSLADLEPAPSREELRGVLSTLVIAPGRAPRDAVRIIDPRSARTIDVDVAIVIGLEDVMFGAGSDAAQDALIDAPDPSDVARHLIYMAATRPRRRLVLVRRVADDDGNQLAPTAIWEDLQTAAGDPVPTHRRRFSDVALPVESAPTVRERARSLAHLAASDRAEAERLAAGAGISGAVRRAIEARRVETPLVDHRVLDPLREREIFGVTDLDRFGDCSQIWFVEKRLGPKVIDQPIDNRLRVGTLAHTVLGRFYKEVPAILQTTVIRPEQAQLAVREVHRIVDEEIAKVRIILPGDRLAMDLLAWGLRRDIGRLVQRAVRLETPLVPSEFEVAFGGRGAQKGRKDGLNVGPAHVSGKIDRIDADPNFSARAMVVDYKTSAISTGAEIRREGKLQIPLYLLALREVLGREPVGGLLISIRKGQARGILDEDQSDVLPPDASSRDRLSHEEFEAVLDEARVAAARRIERIRSGDIKHDPRDPRMCERYCDYGSICRVER